MSDPCLSETRASYGVDALGYDDTVHGLVAEGADHTSRGWLRDAGFTIADSGLVADRPATLVP